MIVVTATRIAKPNCPKSEIPERTAIVVDAGDISFSSLKSNNE